MARKTLLAITMGLVLGGSAAAQSVPDPQDQAQSYRVNVKKAGSEEKKPDASYLVCGIPVNAAPGFKPQKIELRLCSSNSAPDGCAPVDLPIRIGKPFLLKVVNDSGKPVKVTQTYESGIALPVPEDLPKPDPRPNTHRFTIDPLKTGPLVLSATADGDRGAVASSGPECLKDIKPSLFEAKAANMTLFVDQSSGADPSSCARLLPPATQSSPDLDATTIIGLLGSPLPFTLKPAGKGQILVYSPRQRLDLTHRDKDTLKAVESQVDRLRKLAPDDLGVKGPDTTFTVEVTVPHASALGDPANKISSLNNTDFQVVDVGTDKIKITAKKQPGCAAWRAYLANLQHLVWGTTPEPLVARLFYVPTASAASAASAVLNAGGAPSSQPPTPAPQSSPPAGSGTGSGSSTPGTSPQSPAPVAASKPSSTSVAGLDPDMLVLTDANLGDDAAVLEKKRLIAQLDIPRPEMIINAWVMQGSSKYPELVGGFGQMVRKKVSTFNDSLENSVSAAWRFLRTQISLPSSSTDCEAGVPCFFEPSFYRYIAWRYISELPFSPSVARQDEGAEEILNSRSSAKLDDKYRRLLGICRTDEYCLGYGSIFKPLKPRLTDLLITVVAAKTPGPSLCKVIASMEQRESDVTGSAAADVCAPTKTNKGKTTTENRRAQKSLAAYQQELSNRIHQEMEDPTAKDPAYTLDCKQRDLEAFKKLASPGAPVPLRLECLREKAANLFADAPGDDGRQVTPSYVGTLRAAIADFLFNYKMSQQYTHEFEPYELSQSGDALNSAFSPLVEAFNEDLRVYQEFLLAQLDYEVDKLSRYRGAFHWIFPKEKLTKALFGTEDKSFFNSGVVSVRTISGQPAVVDTTTQSFLDASSAPNISDLAAAIQGAAPAAGTTKQPGLLGNISLNQAQLITGALQAYQTTKVQIGRQLTLNVTPRSLSTASSAEIQVSLNAGEPAQPNVFGGPKGAVVPDLPRVSTHNTTTKVRVDSIKLFEVSSFSAELQRGRSRFPLLPPFVELPYIGTIVGIPLPPAKQYHTSIAVLSAVVVPTAADLAYGLQFTHDRILYESKDNACERLIEIPTGLKTASLKEGESEDPSGLKDGVCRARRALSLHDFEDAPIRNFNKAKVMCIATGGGSASYNLQTVGVPDRCKKLSFKDVLHDAF